MKSRKYFTAGMVMMEAMTCSYCFGLASFERDKPAMLVFTVMTLGLLSLSVREWRRV